MEEGNLPPPDDGQKDPDLPQGGVQVMCRFRPLNDAEKTKDTNLSVTIDDDSKTVTFLGEGRPHFTFDRVFGENDSQESIYEHSAKPVVEAVLYGYNGTVLAYGQTSSGKTYTMEGADVDGSRPDLRGIIPRMVKTIFDGVANAPEHIEFVMKVSMVEIYMEKIRDLLNPGRTGLQVHEDPVRGVWMSGSTELYIQEEEEVFEVMRQGAQNRAVACTKMNRDSSRSHSIFVLTLEQKNLEDMSMKTGKLYLVDLAGSERVRKTGASGQTLEEAKIINKSLSALGNVINALTDSKSTHVPYRDSKLTRVLQESLGGNSRTNLIVTCSPSTFNDQETLSTLRFGQRAKNIKNKPRINHERSIKELTMLLAKAEAELELLRHRNAALEARLSALGVQVPGVSHVSSDDADVQGDHASETGSFEEDQAAKCAPQLDTPHSAPAGREQELLQKISELEEEQSRLLLQVESSDRDKLVLIEVQDSLYDDLNDTKEKNIELHEQVGELERKTEEQEKKLFTLEAEMQASETALSRESEYYIKTIAELNFEIDKHKYESSEKDMTIKSLRSQEENMQAQVDEYKSKVEELEKKLSSFAGAAEVLLMQDDEEDEEASVATSAPTDSTAEKSSSMASRASTSLTNLAPHASSVSGGTTAQETSTAIDAILSSMEQNQRATDEEVGELRDCLVAWREDYNHDLKEKMDQIIELQISLDEMRQRNKYLSDKLNEDKSFAGTMKKIINLERKLDATNRDKNLLTRRIDQLLLENRVKDDNLRLKDERIHRLERMLEEQRQKNDKLRQDFEARLEDYRLRVEQFFSSQAAGSPGHSTVEDDVSPDRRPHRMGKRLRGGGGSARGSGSWLTIDDSASVVSGISDDDDTPRSPGLKRFGAVFGDTGGNSMRPVSPPVEPLSETPEDVKSKSKTTERDVLRSIRSVFGK